MNFEVFIAKSLIKAKTTDNSIDRGTKPIIKISVSAIAIGVAVMIIATSIVAGFQKEIKDKVIGFGAHIQVGDYGFNNSVETNPIDKNQPFYPSLDTVSGIKHIQIYATKAGLLKTEENIQGIILKGVSSDFDWEFFNRNLIAGKKINITDSSKTNEVIISKTIANKMMLEVGDEFATYFIQKPARVRKFKIVGIYETGMSQFDEAFVLCDIKHIQKLNNWSENQVSGFEITLEKYSDLNKMDDFIFNYIGMDLNTSKITDRHQDIFSWLELQDWNVVIIIGLMILVSAISMISALLILILEKTNMIGLLKAMGANDWSIRKIFLYNGAYLIFQGLIIGNVIGVAFCLVQQHLEIITLPKESYYVDVVPVLLSFKTVFLLNVGTFLLCTFMLVIPSYVVTKISPVKAIRFN